MARSILGCAAACALGAVIAACGSTSAPSESPPASAGITPGSVATRSPTAATSASAAPANPGHASITVTGAITIQASGPDGRCGYYSPSNRQGYSFSVSSAHLTGTSSANVGGWDLSVQDDSPGGTNPLVYLNTDHGSWTGGRTLQGTIHHDAALKHVDFSLTLIKVVGQQHAQLSGSIDCP